MVRLNTWNYDHAADYTKIRPFTFTMLSLSFRLKASSIVFVVDGHRNKDGGKIGKKTKIK